MKKLIALIGIIILAVPGVLSAYFYREAVAEEKARERLLSVTVIAPDSSEYVYLVDSDDKKHESAVSLFRSLSSLSEKSEKTVEELSSSGHAFTLKYATTHGEYHTSVYILKKETGYLAYFDGGNGIYCIEENARNSFLSSEFSLCVYDSSSIPVLRVSGADVGASSADWRVRVTSGAFSQINTSSIVPEEYSVDNYSGASSISFTTAPDTYTVRVKNAEGELIFSGDSYAFSEFVIDRSKQIHVEIDAIWYQASDKNYYGNASYSFSTYVLAKPEFYLSANETQPGTALLLSCLNIPEGVDVSAMITPQLCDVTLYRNGSNVYTFIPVSYNAEVGTYNLKITYGEASQNLPFAISKKTYLVSTPFSTSQIATERVESCLSEEAVAEYKALLASVSASDSSTLYYNGMLTDYQKLFSLYKGFGFYLQFEGSTLTTRNDGVYFTAKSGSTLTSMGDGVVCAVGECAYLGKYVAVDHGYGLRSWYVTLGETSVKVSDTVKNGEAIGKSGNTGIALTGRTLVMVTVGATPVSPYAFWETDRKFVE